MKMKTYATSPQPPVQSTKASSSLLSGINMTTMAIAGLLMINIVMSTVSLCIVLADKRNADDVSNQLGDIKDSISQLKDALQSLDGVVKEDEEIVDAIVEELGDRIDTINGTIIEVSNNLTLGQASIVSSITQLQLNLSGVLINITDLHAELVDGLDSINSDITHIHEQIGNISITIDNLSANITDGLDSIKSSITVINETVGNNTITIQQLNVLINSTAATVAEHETDITTLNGTLHDITLSVSLPNGEVVNITEIFFEFKNGTYTDLVNNVTVQGGVLNNHTNFIGNLSQYVQTGSVKFVCQLSTEVGGQACQSCDATLGDCATRRNTFSDQATHPVTFAFPYLFKPNVVTGISQTEDQFLSFGDELDFAITVISGNITTDGFVMALHANFTSPTAIFSFYVDWFASIPIQDIAGQADGTFVRSVRRDHPYYYSNDNNSNNNNNIGANVIAPFRSKLKIT